MFIEQLGFAGIIKNPVLMGAQAGQDRGARKGKTEDGGPDAADLTAFTGIEGDDFAVGRLPDFALIRVSGQAKDRTRRKAAAGLGQVFSCCIMERNGMEGLTVFRGQEDPDNSVGNLNLTHRTPFSL